MAKRRARSRKIEPSSSLAGIAYVGISGISKESQDGVLRLIQYGNEITRARILSNSGDHCLLLTVNTGDLMAVKSGFASGYLGEGPRTFSYVLEVLRTHEVEIDEYKVSPALIERLDSSALTRADIRRIEKSRPVRPVRWHEYLIDKDFDGSDPWREFPAVIPFAIIDTRLTGLAAKFWDEADSRLIKGYRRLEDIVRKRTGIAGQGQKLFSQAFDPQKRQLVWRNMEESECIGKMNLFTAAYMAHRNPRAHREQPSSKHLLSEFLLLNHLYVTEKEAVVVLGNVTFEYNPLDPLSHG